MHGENLKSNYAFYCVCSCCQLQSSCVAAHRGTEATHKCNRFILSSLHTTLWLSLHIQCIIELSGLQGGNTLQNKALLLPQNRVLKIMWSSIILGILYRSYVGFIDLPLTSYPHLLLNFSSILFSFSPHSQITVQYATKLLTAWLQKVFLNAITHTPKYFSERPRSL